MTREHKLVMVIGFGLLLFVGILVSDHLSAQDAQFSRPDSIVDVALRKELQLPPAEGDIGDFGSVRRGGEVPPTVDGVEIIRIGGGESTVAPPAAPPTAAPTERTYTVASGDNPEKIALKFYGKRSLATKLAEFNDVAPSKLRIGQVLKIPDLNVLDPNAAVAKSAGEVIPVPPQPQEQAAPAPVETKGKVVKVQKGDSLWKIAGRAYGKATAANVKELHQLNPGLNEKNLRIGAEVRISTGG